MHTIGMYLSNSQKYSHNMTYYFGNKYISPPPQIFNEFLSMFSLKL